MIILPFLISAVIGYLLLDFLTRKADPLNFTLKIFLGTGLGLGLSSHLTFYSFLFFNHLEPKIIIITHFIILIFLLMLRIKTKLADKDGGNSFLKKFPSPFLIMSVVIPVILVVTCVILQAHVYPYGGWDAWQVWNFKAKFLLLSGEHWQNLFSPELWRSSPHYPLLLPLINVWAWLFTPKPVDIIPMITSIIFTLLTVGLLCGALWQKTKSLLALLPGLLLLTLPFFNLQATTQYCDIVLSFYLLAAIITLSEEKNSYALIAGLFTGFLGFTKPEGMVAALLIVFIVGILTGWGLLRKDKTFSFTKAWLFIVGLTVASLPTLAFHIILSPGNQTFVNGLTSTLAPATWERLQVIMFFFAMELKSAKWNGLWFLLLLGIILGGKNLWTKNKITAGFLLLYLTVIIVYYQLNTYFKITWWLSVSLDRILFSLLPLFLFWIFSSILSSQKENH